MNEKEIKEKINKDEDFINYPRYGNSIKSLIENNPDGVDNKKISKALMITEKEVEELYKSAISRIRNSIGE